MIAGKPRSHWREMARRNSLEGLAPSDLRALVKQLDLLADLLSEASVYCPHDPHDPLLGDNIEAALIELDS